MWWISEEEDREGRETQEREDSMDERIEKKMVNSVGGNGIVMVFTVQETHIQNESTAKSLSVCESEVLWMKKWEDWGGEKEHTCAYEAETELLASTPTPFLLP